MLWQRRLRTECPGQRGEGILPAVILDSRYDFDYINWIARDADVSQFRDRF